MNNSDINKRSEIFTLPSHRWDKQTFTEYCTLLYNGIIFIIELKRTTLIFIIPKEIIFCKGSKISFKHVESRKRHDFKNPNMSLILNESWVTKYFVTKT